MEISRRLVAAEGNFLTIGVKAMVGLDLETVQKITWRFEGYASTRRRIMYGRCKADTA
jgi:hypothetical protein